MPTFGKVDKLPSSPAKESTGTNGNGGGNDNDDKASASASMAAATASATILVTQQSQQEQEVVVDSSNANANGTALTSHTMNTNNVPPPQQPHQPHHPPPPPPSQAQHPPSTFTRVDGKGLWRSWKRNFTNKLLALLDLIDNSLDAAIVTAAPTIDTTSTASGGGNNGNGNGNSDSNSDDDGERDHLSNFIGRVHIYPDDIHIPQQLQLQLQLNQHGNTTTNQSSAAAANNPTSNANANSSNYFNSTSSTTSTTNRTSPRRKSPSAAARGNGIVNSLLLGKEEQEEGEEGGGGIGKIETITPDAVTSSHGTTATATATATTAAHNSSSQDNRPTTTNTNNTTNTNTNTTTNNKSTPPPPKPTGLVIINNCVKPIRPLTKVLEVYNSSKIDSGADHIGENGVGLKQGCATLSDLSFVLVKNEKEGFVELGMIAEQLQRPEGCYLPAFKFDIPHDKDDVHDDPSLNEANKLAIQDQMIELFTQPKHADSKWCIARYGDGTTRPNFEIGMHRLIQHFDSVLNFYKNPYVFCVVMDNMSYGNKHPTSFDDLGKRPAAADPIADLRAAIPKTYLHVPEKFDFRIGRQKNGREKVVFDYWPQRLVEMSSFKVKISQSVPWNHHNYNRDRNAYTLRVFVGFNRFRINSEEPKAASLYVYSRDAGRLIKHEPDARHLLGIGAGGSTYSSGLTILIDDISGNLPLSPTKQDVAFGEEAHGDIHKMNLFAWVGAITRFFYDYHLEEKFGKKKVPLTSAIKAFGSAPDQREMPPIDKSQFTTFNVKFTFWQNRFIRADKKQARENQGRNTYFKLVPPRQPTVSRTLAPQQQPNASSNQMADREDHISKKRKLDQMQAMNGQMFAELQQRLDGQQQQQQQHQAQRHQQQMIQQQQQQQHQQQQRIIHQQQQRIQQQQHGQQLRHIQQQQQQLMAVPTTLNNLNNNSLNNNNRQQINGHQQTAHSRQAPEYLQNLRAPVGASQQQNGQHHPHQHHQSQRQPQQQPQQQHTENRPGIIQQPPETLSNPIASKVASNAQSKKMDIEIVDLCDEDDDEPSKKDVPANGSNGKAPANDANVKKETTDPNNVAEAAAVNGGNEEDDNDDTSVASTKDYYKSLCERMAIQLEKKKDADHQRKKENKRLKQEVQELKKEVERQKKLLAKDQQI